MADVILRLGLTGKCGCLGMKNLVVGLVRHRERLTGNCDRIRLWTDQSAEIGRERGYQEGWFNDGVKGFVSERGEFTQANLPQFSNLRVMMPVPSYLLAMKCLAARATT